jgi:hypothetical protein
MNPDTPRKYWDVGNDIPFRLSKDRCQKLLEALLRCDGKITDMFSLDIDFKTRELKYHMKPHEIAVLCRISLPEGQEFSFESIMGSKCLSEPPKLCLN